MMNQISKTFIIFGVLFLFIGFLLQFFGKLPGFGRFPGDLYIRKGSFTFYFPVVTSLLISLVLSFIINLFWRK